MPTPTRRAWATIDCAALRHNLAQVRSRCPESAIYAVIKSNAYGHGMAPAARTIAASGVDVAGFAVATLDEALSLAALDLGLPIMLLSGFINRDEASLCLMQGIEPVLHAPHQLPLLDQCLAESPPRQPTRVWVKHNSGMNRLGLNERNCHEAFQMLSRHDRVQAVFMSHLAYADDMDNPASRSFTESQLQRFQDTHRAVAQGFGSGVPRSLAASAGILTLPDTHFDYVRPGVMLYGSSPLAKIMGPECGLRAVMTLSSRLIAINPVAAGASVGYNATYTCDRDTLVGVVSIGYGDGYPRSAANGTPVLVNTAGGTHRCPLLGRVSMDMITIDLTGLEQVEVGDEVELWGHKLAADEVARHAGTIAYELFCKVTPRVSVTHTGQGD